MANQVKSKLKDILLDINIARLSNRYFGKSSSWLYHKLDGTDGKTKDLDFTPEELQALRNALHDLAGRISKAADTI